MSQQELIELLREKSSQENNGRGIQCVRNILSCWDRGDKDGAARVRSLEGDKTVSYPEIESLLKEIFGCRLHLKHDCQDRWCKNEKD